MWREPPARAAVARTQSVFARWRKGRHERRANKSGFAGWFEAIPDPGFSDDVAWCIGGVYFLAELSNQHAQEFRLLQAVGSPDGKQQGGMRYHPAGVPGQVKQNFEFFRSKPDFAAPH